MYIKEHELKEPNLILKRISNNSFYEYHSDNKEDNIKAVINYYSYIALIVYDNIIINHDFYNYSTTTNRLIYSLDYNKDVIIINNESFKKLLNYYRTNNKECLFKELFNLKHKKQLNLKIIDIINNGGGLDNIYKDLKKHDINIYSYYSFNKNIELKTRYKDIIEYNYNGLKLEEVITFNKSKNKELNRRVKILNDFNYYEYNAGGVLSIE